MSNQNGGLLFFAGFVTGGVIGASLALLLAPQSGQETRDQIRDKGIELRDGAVEGFTETSQRAQTQIATWQEALEKGKHNAVEAPWLSNHYLKEVAVLSGVQAQPVWMRAAQAVSASLQVACDVNGTDAAVGLRAPANDDGELCTLPRGLGGFARVGLVRSPQ